MRRLSEWLFGRHHEPAADPAQELENERIRHDAEAMRRDLEQVQRINTYLLKELVERGQLSPEAAEAIRVTQTTEHEQEDMALGFERLRAKVNMRARDA